MAVDNTLLMREVEEIRDNGLGDTGWRIDMHLVVKETTWIKPFKVEYEQLHRDYASKDQFADRRVVQFMMQQGDFQYDIIPNRDNLLAELVYVPLKNHSVTPDTSKKSEVKRFRCVLITQFNNAITNKNSQVSSREALNQLAMISVAVQLIDEAAYRINMMSYGNCLRQCTSMMAIQEVLSSTITPVGIQASKAVLGINFQEGYNANIRTVMDFPDGIKLRDIPHYIHEEEGGVYSTGLGRYFQDGYWYIYSLYDSTQYRKNTKVLKLINVPNDRYQGSERTYKIDEQHVTVLATGDAKALDNGLAENLKEGNGLRFGDVTKLLEGFGTAKDNRTLVDRASNIFEVSTGLLETGLNNIRWAVDRATSNPFKHYSEMARRRGMMLTLQWQNGDSDLLYPGMPVKFITVSDNLVETYNGVLLGVDEQRSQPDSNVEITQHTGIVTLGVFINRKEGDPIITDPSVAQIT